MKPHIAILFTSVLVFLYGCKKENEYCSDGFVLEQQHSFDTIYPSDYLMAYPGSWWVYSDGTIDTCRFWEAVPIRYQMDETDCPLVREDMVVIPYGFFHKSKFERRHVYGNSAVFTGELSSRFIPLVDTVIGVVYLIGSECYYCDWEKLELIERLDTFQVLNTVFHDVLHLKHQKVTYNHLGEGPPLLIDFYYAKNVGLIKEEGDDYGYYGWGQNIDRELVDYHIAPH